MQRVLSYSFVEVLRAILAAYGEARGRAAAERELQHMSDHMLRDIGLYRGECRL